jgi:hypothetical protein
MKTVNVGRLRLGCQAMDGRERQSKAVGERRRSPLRPTEHQLGKLIGSGASSSTNHGPSRLYEMHAHTPRSTG